MKAGRKQPSRWGQEEFRAFLAWLNPDKHKAADEYVRLIQRLQFFFEARHDAASHAAELADLTIDRTIKKLAEEQEVASKDPLRYVQNVAHYILLEFRKAGLTLPLTVDPPDPRATANDIQVPRMDCLEKCLAELPAEDAELVRKYHLRDESERVRSRQGAAKELGITAGALRVRVFRICRRLAECVADCMKKRGL
jgi:hypothetical protein